MDRSIFDKYEPVIGLEVHAQMKTKTKAFCRCSTDFHSSPNSNVCPVCLGYPGTLPVLNEELVDYSIRMGLAVNCSIRENSIFARKNYFYPDLTKGYQITQFETPLCYNGFLIIDMTKYNVKIAKDSKVDIVPTSELRLKRIGITRIHLEEDAGKSIHDFHDDDTLIDFNRCGVPLIEIVSEPDINSTEEAYQYLSKIRQTLVYLEINDGNLEEGSMRCDANVSVRLKGTKELGTRTEIKNLNSFKNVVDAIESEIKRQTELIESGEKVYYQTMTYNAKERKTTATRSKEEAHDYRYFPEPDLVKLKVDREWINKVEKELPEFPDAKKERFLKKYSISESDAEELTQDKKFAEYFEKISGYLINKNEKTYRSVANILRVDVKRILNDKKIELNEFPLSERMIAMLADSVSAGNISVTASKEIFSQLLEGKTEEDQEKIFRKAEESLSQVSDNTEIELIVKKIIEENPKETERYRIGEKKLAGFFVGKIMQESKGKANPKVVNELLIKNLEA